MRFVAALIVLCALGSTPAYACDTVVGWVGVPLCGADAGSSTTAVPDVKAEASFAAADAVLEGVGLDGLQGTTCSAEAMGQVARQNPSAGTLVEPGTVVSVATSTGTACPKGGRVRLGIGLGL